MIILTYVIEVISNGGQFLQRTTGYTESIEYAINMLDVVQLKWSVMLRVALGSITDVQETPSLTAALLFY